MKRAPLTAQEIDDAREWLTGYAMRQSRYRLLGEPELPVEVYAHNLDRAFDELEALKREMDEACRRLAFTEGQERRASDNNARLRARLEAVEADRDRYRDTMRASLQRVTDLLAAAPLDYWLISERKAAVSEARAILAAHAVLAPDTKDDPDPHGIRAATDMLLGDGGDDAA